ncbi:MAG: YfbM family protein [Treponema sp.]|nr:YfbM family protein [Treponema sp.]
MDLQLDEFVHQVNKRMEEVDASSGHMALELQTRLSVYMTEQIKKLMKQGIPVMTIQDALRTAVNDRVEQTYAPDADDNDEETGERLEPPIGGITYYLPMEEAVIAAFAAGDLDGMALVEQIRESPDITLLEMTDGLDLVLSDFGKNQKLCDITYAGEIVAGSDGEAFIPEYLNVKEADGYQYIICDPAVFKSATEVKSIAALLEPLNQEAFSKKANIKKLIKSGWLDAYDPRSVKKEASFIINELWNGFAVLQELYLKAAEQQKGILIFVGYQGDTDLDT